MPAISTSFQESSPARLSQRSEREKPKGRTKVRRVPVTAQVRTTFPVFWGISGSKRMISISLNLATFWTRLPRLFALGRSTYGRTGSYLNQEGVFNPFLPELNNSPESKYLEAFGPKKLQSSSFTVCLFQEE